MTLISYTFIITHVKDYITVFYDRVLFITVVLILTKRNFMYTSKTTFSITTILSLRFEINIGQDRVFPLEMLQLGTNFTTNNVTVLRL